MIIEKEKMKIEFNENVPEMKEQIKELEKLKEAIKQSNDYKLLFGKTQMIHNDEKSKVQSRGGHSAAVATISRKIVAGIYDKTANEEFKQTEIYNLNLKIAKLYAEITGLSHDLGHTPFGHAGESGLNDFVMSISNVDEKKKILNTRKEIFGKEYEENQGHDETFIENLIANEISFQHNEQSAIVFNKLFDNNQIDEKLVDKNRIIIGILSHSVSRVRENNIPSDIASQAVRQADKIEYANKDYDELKECVKLYPEEDIYKYANRPLIVRLNETIDELVDEAIEKGKIDDHMKSMETMKKLKKVTDTAIVWMDEDGKRGLIKGENIERIRRMIMKIAEYYYNNPEKIVDKRYGKINPINRNRQIKRGVLYEKEPDKMLTENIIRFINSFDNVQCEREYKKLVKERIIYGPGNGVEPITSQEIEIEKREQLYDRVNKNFYKIANGNLDDISWSFGEKQRKAMEVEGNYLKTRVTVTGKNNIKDNRKKHLKELEEDKKLYEYMLIADRLREESKEKNMTEDEIKERIEKIVLGTDTKAKGERVMAKMKEEGKHHQGR